MSVFFMDPLAEGRLFIYLLLSFWAGFSLRLYVFWLTSRIQDSPRALRTAYIVGKLMGILSLVLFVVSILYLSGQGMVFLVSFSLGTLMLSLYFDLKEMWEECRDVVFYY